MADLPSDGLDESAERLLQVTLTAAAQLAERLAQAVPTPPAKPRR